MMRITIEPPPYLSYANKLKALFAALGYGYNRNARRVEGNVEKIHRRGSMKAVSSWGFLENLGVYGRIKIKWFLKKWDGSMDWIDLA
jgi:hypothetical protein